MQQALCAPALLPVLLLVVLLILVALLLLVLLLVPWTRTRGPKGNGDDPYGRRHGALSRAALHHDGGDDDRDDGGGGVHDDAHAHA